MAYAIYIYSFLMAFAWLGWWCPDICYWLDGTKCNDTETLTIRMCSFLFLYLTALPFMLFRTNVDNLAFIKRLAIHMEYGIAIMMGTMITMTPTGVEPKWWHMTDTVFFFFLFFILFVYTTSNDTAPIGQYQRLWEGHGVNPRSLLVLVAAIVLVKIVTLPDYFPLSEFVNDPDTITVRAETFYSMALCLVLALFFILIVPVFYGNPKDQLNTTVLILVVEFVFGLAMFWRLFHVINSDWRRVIGFGSLGFLGLICIALIGAYYDAKRGKYDLIPSNHNGVQGQSMVV